MVNERCDFWKAQLSVPESKLLYKDPLNANDRQTSEEAAGNLAVY
jgi:hypothetical protein